MNWKKLFNIPSNNDVVEQPKPVEKIGCIAQSIINDLAVENINDWGQLRMFSTQFKRIRHRTKKYILNREIHRMGHGFYYVIMLEDDFTQFTSVKFNNVESKAIYDAMEILADKVKAAELQQQTLEEQAKLKEIFPNCF